MPRRRAVPRRDSWTTRTLRTRAAVVAARDLRVVLSSAPPGEALRLASALVDAGAAACVSVVPGVRSVYRWQGAVRRDRESLLVVKTTRGALARCLRTLAFEHPYEVPEALVLEPSSALAAYGRWIRETSVPDARKAVRRRGLRKS